MDEKSPFSGFTEVPHTADAAIDVFAPNLSELFINAAQGLYHILEIRKGTERPELFNLEMEELDHESLLIGFLNELLYWVEKKKVASSIDIEISGWKLRATVFLTDIESRNKEVKAVTYSELKIHSFEGGLKTRIVFDI